MLRHGRFPPEVVLEIARSMLADLAAMESAGLVHGDIRVENVLLQADGTICLPQPGLRGVIRPHEGIAYLDLSPEACGSLRAGTRGLRLTSNDLQRPLRLRLRMVANALRPASVGRR